MKKYKVISPFVERDEQGTVTGNRPQIGEVVELPTDEGKRLATAQCVVLIEEAIKTVPEDRRVKRDTKPDKRVKRRTAKS
jgi:hypothetical protein